VLLALIAQMSDEAAGKDTKLAEVEAENTQLKDALAASTDEAKRLNEILDAFKRHRFGTRAERLDPDQYQLILEEVETAIGRVDARLDCVTPASSTPQPHRRINRGALAAHLERIERLVDIADKACACCGGALHVIGEDVSERLDVVPTQFRVLVTRRPRYGCRGCDEGKVVQAPAPNWIVDQGLPTNALVAQVVVSRYADHQPLYRQAQIYSRQGIDLDRSTLADWVGRAAWWLLPLREHLLGRLRSSTKLFADETTMPVLAPKTGKTKKGQLWAYARDDRPWGGTTPPAVVYMYATSRGSNEPIAHLKGFSGILQVDGYTGYNKIASGGDVTLALCLSHARRKFYELEHTEPVAAEVLRRFAMIYKVEATLRGKMPKERLVGRQDAMTALLAEFREYLGQNRRRFSAKSKMADAINYMLDRWDGLTRFMGDGRIELDTNVVERSIRPIALSRKNSLFAGSDLGADNWAVIASLLETAKLNSVDPLAWLISTLTKLANGHSSKDLDALMPWTFTKHIHR
jgi:transposase